jgi:DNA end-binding protein Ku
MARAIWKGTLGFGLVNVSVELLSATKTDEFDLDLLDRRDHAHIGYQKINKSTGKPVDASDIVRGFAVAEDRYVILTDADLKAANPAATQSIDILGFVPQADVPRMYYDRPYYVSPLKGSERAYGLLRDALADADRLALAQIVIHTRQHMAAVYPHGKALVVQLLRYAADLREPDDAGVKTTPAAAKAATSRELTMARQLMHSMAMDWEPTSYRDTYRDDLMKLVRAREKKGTSAKTPAVVDSAAKPTRVLDLVAALQQSLSAPRRGKAAAPAKRARKTTTKRGRVA